MYLVCGGRWEGCVCTMKGWLVWNGWKAFLLFNAHIVLYICCSPFSKKGRVISDIWNSEERNCTQCTTNFNHCSNNVHYLWSKRNKTPPHFALCTLAHDFCTKPFSLVMYPPSLLLSHFCQEIITCQTRNIWIFPLFFHRFHRNGVFKDIKLKHNKLFSCWYLKSSEGCFQIRIIHVTFGKQMRFSKTLPLSLYSFSTWEYSPGDWADIPSTGPT